MRAVLTIWVLVAIAWYHLDTAAATKLHNYGIYGGRHVNITEVPFMAIFSSEAGGWGCGASIVHEQFLVTAAHCVRVCKFITVGTDTITGGQLCKIEKIYIHPRYNQRTFDYDIAVIKLKKKLTFSDRVNLIHMADSTLIPSPGDMMFTIGFGLTEHGNFSNDLLGVNISYVDRKKCNEMLNNTVTAQMLCAGGEENKGSCHADSGGALVYKGKLAGVVSWVTDGVCGKKDSPVVYADVASMHHFINAVISKHS